MSLRLPLSSELCPPPLGLMLVPAVPPVVVYVTMLDWQDFHEVSAAPPETPPGALHYDAPIPTARPLQKGMYVKLFALVPLHPDYFLQYQGRRNVLCPNDIYIEGWITKVVSITSEAVCFLVGGLGTSIAIHLIPKWAEFHKFQVVVIVWLICAAVCDILITVSLTWHLVRDLSSIAPLDLILFLSSRGDIRLASLVLMTC